MELITGRPLAADRLGPRDVAIVAELASTHEAGPA